jgi:hypothetical protein
MDAGFTVSIMENPVTDQSIHLGETAPTLIEGVVISHDFPLIVALEVFQNIITYGSFSHFEIDSNPTLRLSLFVVFAGPEGMCEGPP